MGKKRKKGLGDSTLGTGKGRVGKTRSKIRGLTVRPRPARKGGRPPRSIGRGLGNSRMGQAGRRRKGGQLARASFDSAFKSRMMGRGFGSIFQGRKSSGKGLVNVFKNIGSMPGLGAGARPEKGIGAASAGRSPRFSGGIFSSVLGSVGRGLGLSPGKALSSGFPGLPGVSPASDLVGIIRQYVQARVRGDSSAYRQTRSRLQDRVGTLLADRILRWVNGEASVPNDLTRIQGLENSSPQLRETIIWARDVLNDLTMRDGTRNQLDYDAEEAEARREYEDFLETL